MSGAVGPPATPDGQRVRRSGSVLYMTIDLLARYAKGAGGSLETLSIDGLRRSDRIRTIENLASVPCLVHLELTCHAISCFAPVLVCSVSSSAPLFVCVCICCVRVLCLLASTCGQIRIPWGNRGSSSCLCESVSVSVLCRIVDINDSTQALRTLKLADNAIVRLENLTLLPKLEVLDLSGNRILTIAKMERTHQRLHTVKLAHNRLTVLADIENLRAVKNLAILSVEGNPLGAHAHTRPYSIFHLRLLDTLDGHSVTAQERAEATARFGDETLASLRASLRHAMQENGALKERALMLEERVSKAEKAKILLRCEVEALQKTEGDKNGEIARLLLALKATHQLGATSQEHTFRLEQDLDRLRQQVDVYEWQASKVEGTSIHDSFSRNSIVAASPGSSLPAEEGWCENTGSNPHSPRRGHVAAATHDQIRQCVEAVEALQMPGHPRAFQPLDLPNTHQGDWQVFSRGAASPENSMLLRASPSSEYSSPSPDECDTVLDIAELEHGLAPPPPPHLLRREDSRDGSDTERDRQKREREDTHNGNSQHDGGAHALLLAQRAEGAESLLLQVAQALQGNVMEFAPEGSEESAHDRGECRV